MGKKTEFNRELRDQINKTFTELFDEIGNNRQQLFNKVLSVHQRINKELTKSAADANKQKEILREVSATLRMASSQLPQIKTSLKGPSSK